ncbi:MAG TPA: lytic transglycosylase, partial [Ramlibacter sp.]|nr:lytic transglycosylase [Ramlibacter sp.]
MTLLLRAASLALTLWLAGCAGVPLEAGQPERAPAPVADAAPQPAEVPPPRPDPRPVPVPAAAAPPPVFPTGPLQPITVAAAPARITVVPTETPVDLWERIRIGYTMPNLETDLVRRHEQWYATRPDYMQRMTDRSRKYLFHIVEELERRGMPTELALLPFIES